MKRAVSKRLRELVEGMEAEGYLIGMTQTGTAFWVGFPDHAPPEVCGLMKLNDARFNDPEMDAALLPWLNRNRPFALLQRQAMERRT